MRPFLRALPLLLLFAEALCGAGPPGVSETVSRLVARLGSPEAKERDLAYEELLRIGADSPESVLPHLPEDRSDPEVGLRCDALRTQIPREARRRKAFRLAEGDPDLQARLERFLSDADRERTDGFAGVAEGSRERAAGILLLLAEEEDRRERCIRALSGLGRTSAMSCLLEWLAEPRWSFPASEALIEIRDPSAAPAVAKLLSDPDRGVRSSAIRILGSLGDRSVAPRIEAALEDRDPLVRGSAAHALANLEAAEHAEAISRLLEDPDPSCRKDAIQALGRLKAASFASRIVPFLKKRDPSARLFAAQALGQIQDPSTAPDLAALLKDPEPQVRLHAIQALGRMQAVRFAPDLFPFLDDPDMTLRLVAATALRSMADQAWPDGSLVRAAKDWRKKHQQACKNPSCPFCPRKK